MWDVNDKGLEETQKMIDQVGGKAFWSKVDVADSKATDAGCQAAVDKFGRLDGGANIAVS
jgi:NAD(P)-dependent dehydrogenase (short-subunit alcohol dehydrogenase family)